MVILRVMMFEVGKRHGYGASSKPDADTIGVVPTIRDAALTAAFLPKSRPRAAPPMKSLPSAPLGRLRSSVAVSVLLPYAPSSSTTVTSSTGVWHRTPT